MDVCVLKLSILCRLIADKFDTDAKHHMEHLFSYKLM